MTANMTDEISPVDRVRQVFTTCGTKQAVVQQAAARPNAVMADIDHSFTLFAPHLISLLVIDWSPIACGLSERRVRGDKYDG
jgi:hypothetical protein